MGQFGDAFAVLYLGTHSVLEEVRDRIDAVDAKERALNRRSIREIACAEFDACGCHRARSRALRIARQAANPHAASDQRARRGAALRLRHTGDQDELRSGYVHARPLWLRGGEGCAARRHEGQAFAHRHR
jgi:hypothetical protein